MAELERYRRGEARPKDPIVIEHYLGRLKPSDVIWITVGSLVVSDRLAAVLAGFSGWSPYPVEVYDGRGTLVPGYVGVAIAGRCGPMWDDTARVEGEGIWAEYVGLWFRTDTWDESDIFYPAAGPGPVVTAPLRDALRRARPSNLRMTSLPDYRSNKAQVDRFIEQRSGAYAFDDHPPPQESVPEGGAGG